MQCPISQQCSNQYAIYWFLICLELFVRGLHWNYDNKDIFGFILISKNIIDLQKILFNPSNLCRQRGKVHYAVQTRGAIQMAKIISFND